MRVSPSEYSSKINDHKVINSKKSSLEIKNINNSQYIIDEKINSKE